jgi:hypothetical protein
MLGIEDRALELILTYFILNFLSSLEPHPKIIIFFPSLLLPLDWALPEKVLLRQVKTSLKQIFFLP